MSCPESRTLSGMAVSVSHQAPTPPQGAPTRAVYDRRFEADPEGGLSLP